MKNRFFNAPAGSPLHLEIERLTKARVKAFSALKAFMAAEGCSDMYGTSPNDYLFDFKSMDEVDTKKWAQVKRRLRQGTVIYFRAKRNTPEGKELADRIMALPACPSLSTAINAVPGLKEGVPMAMDGYRVYFPFLRYFNPKTGVLIVAVPAPEVDAKELAAYAKQAASGKRSRRESNLDTALWQPPQWLTEIKEWEAMKAIDQDESQGEKPKVTGVKAPRAGRSA